MSRPRAEIANDSRMEKTDRERTGFRSGSNGHGEARTPLFSARGLTKVYSAGEVKVRALDGVDLDLYAGEFIVLLGPSGSGKSTLLNNLGGLDVPTSGTLTYKGREISGADEDELTVFRR